MLSTNIKALTALRFLAAGIVFLHHAGAYTTPATGVAFGAIGVGFFFMLSGLILSHVYHRRLAMEGVRRFYIARIARIVPLHVFTAAMAWVLFPPQPQWQEVVRLGLNLTLLHGNFPLQSIYYSLNWPSWSLSAEMFFYLLFPLLLPLVARVRRGYLPVALLVILCAMTLWALAWDGERWATYILPAARLGEFLSGMILWRLLSGVSVSPRQATIVEIAALAALGALMARYEIVPVALQWSVAFYLPCLALLAIFALSAGLVSRLLSWRPLVWLGEISFAFYMVHQLIIRALPDAGWAVWFGLGLASAALLHYAVEIPMQRFLHNRAVRASS